MNPTTMSSSTTPGLHPSSDGTVGRTVGPLLVATTGRDATAVITAARLLAERLGTAPQIVAVNEPPPVFPPGVSDLYAEQPRRLRNDVVRAVRSAYDGDPSWPVEVVDGPPARTIAHVARERRARMIVMGIGRHAPMDRVFGTETALQTIRVADRPVLAVAPNFAELPRRAVVAVDFSPPSVRAAEEALAFLAGGGTLSLVYVRPRDIDVVRVDDEIVPWHHGERVTALFERLVARLKAPSARPEHLIGTLAAPPAVTVEPVMLVGDPATEVLSFAEREGADLIAAGSSGQGFFDRLIVGSVATWLLRRSPVSLLVVPRPSDAEVEHIERQLAAVMDAPQAGR